MMSLNNYVHFRISSDISTCVCKSTSFPGSSSYATSATVMDPPDDLPYQHVAQVLDEQQSEQKATIFCSDQPSDYLFVHLLHNLVVKSEKIR